MQWATGFAGCGSLLTVAGDTPFFPGDLAERLAEAVSSPPARIAVATSAGRRHPVFALWPLTLKERLEHFLTVAGDRRVSAFIDAQGAVEVTFPMVARIGKAFDPFFNVNTPEDLTEARRISEILDP
jgi:molybdopterin-guanine dinucleotide biosynthesis protein A